MYDVIVVGAGPAGSYAAYKSASSGLETLLIEKDRLPRWKACGGIVDGRTLSKLDRGIFDAVEAKGSFTNVFYNSKRIQALERDDYFFKREKFDYFITKMAMDAGVEVVDSCPVTDVTNRPEGVAVRTAHMELKSRLLIGADGVHSTVGKSIGLVHNHSRMYAAMVASVGLQSYENLLGEGDHSNMYFFEDLLGFAWLIPNKESVNIGIGALTRKSRGLRGKFERFCAGIDIPCPKVHGHMIPYKLLEKIQSGRVMLVGDAAGFVNAWTGGGIPPGIYSAEKAAETCLEMIENDDFSEKASRRYPSRCRSAFRNLRFRTKLVEILDSDTPSDFELPGIAKSLVRRLSAVASQSL
ncbi:MAG: geranylgeranyl reductase family protein [Thermoplasmata archaeon]|nr:geranylgeranyl reductase family protein [Thermoplasmata archaeon]